MPSKTEQMNAKPTISNKKKRRNKSDLGPNFVAPDGGWGWAVCVAAGFTFFCTLPALMQFGLIFRDHLLQLGLTNTEITTLINVNSAVSACSGLFNGPMFRVLTHRQAAFLGAILITTGLIAASFSNSFITYLLTFSIVYGYGLGISMSASTLAVYTYFKEKRRIAAGIQWSISGVSPIVMPYIAAFLLPIFGVQGSVIIFSGIAFHAIICGMIYQPVLRHVKKHDKQSAIEEQGTALVNVCEFCAATKARRSTYVNINPTSSADYEEEHTYVNIDPVTRRLSRASSINVDPNIRKLARASYVNIDPNTRKVSQADDGPINPNERDARQMPHRCTCSAEREALLEESANRNATKRGDHIKSKESLSFRQKICAFFDLDLLKDFTYINLTIGLTTANFADMNYAILTPFILRDYGFDQTQIANTMALLAITDISLRFVIPFIASRISWQNKTFFLVGIIITALGRIVVAHSQDYYTVLAISAWIGIGRALRIVFMTLVIPSHVPLDRLPAASGLKLLFKGVFTLAAGPIVGKIRDASNYTITLHCLNIATLWTILSWWLEDIYRKRKKKETKGRSHN